ncbi:receptor-like protein EIX1 [Cornus florida]|uniref:receptor-like protein EIX1 n=1 Tax=Cornus florida TaxID=4283 RepID=UPI0028969E31|nr:receptor-like protein EIX1 [Cornus florida]
MANNTTFLSLLLVRLLFLVMLFLGSSSFLVNNMTKLTSAKCIEMERKALVNFKHGLKDHTGSLSSWKGEDCCQWRGVGCNNITGHVVKLDLRGKAFDSNEYYYYVPKTFVLHYRRSRLGGKISSSLLKLKYLNYLDLSSNDFGGIRIPKFLSMFENLRYLNLSCSMFGGEIPSHLGNLSSLNYLDLGDDYLIWFNEVSLWPVDLHTSNLKWLSGLSSLKYLNMQNLEVNDTNWLQLVNMLPNLMELHLPGCGLPSLPLSLPFVNLTLLSVLDISGNGLISSIPNWLSNLTSLTKLDLSVNHFSGVISSEFVKLTSLEDLDLFSNRFEGQVPIFFGNLCMLKILDLQRNNFNGEVVEFFGAFSGCPTSSLMSLSLAYNSFEGELPDSIGILNNLQRLDLWGNSFWGSIPKSIGNLSSLQEFYLSANQMNGTIPESFGQLSKLRFLYLRSNSWEGVVTEAQLMNLTRLEDFRISTEKFGSLIFNVTYEWVPPFRLKILEIENCLVGPRFPVWLQVQNELTHVSLTNVGIADTIAEEWFSMLSSQVVHLDLSNNQIKGKLPINLEYPELYTIDLSNNCFEGLLPLWSTNASNLILYSNLFSGPIPSNMDKLMPKVRFLLLSKNRLNGTIPSSICTMKNLEYLVLGTNQLFGELPHCWNKFQMLKLLDVANNSLSGNIPSSIGSLSSLGTLLLSSNNLNGQIPQSLQNCSNICIIDLGGNRLNGKLPLWIGHNTTPFLELLRLRSNSFRGSIPQQWCNLKSLHILDLAHNNLSGVIPTCFANFSLSSNGSSITISVDQISLVAKGRELRYGWTLQFVNSIDFSANSLVGEIPEEITNLVALGTLNFSMNYLSGRIPENIGNLRNLETLDLSNNNLSGPIPQSLSSLFFLNHLNLSHNNLVGKIPTGNQLQTFDDPSIYEGNPLLCGLPLTKCLGDVTSNVPPLNGGGLNHSDNGNDLDMAWFYYSMGPGFVVGFWVVLGTLLIKKTWRHALFQFVENMTERITLMIALRRARL